MPEQIISTGVKAAYDGFYEKNDEGWRKLGAKYKAQHIIDVCAGRQFDSVLEVGAGDGSILQILAEKKFASQYSATEISQSGVDRILSLDIPNMQSVLVFDGYHLPYKDDEFDLVILSHVLEHVEHERLLLRELKRVAKMCVIEVPKDYRFGVDQRIKHFLAYGHINVYTPTSLRYMLLTEGFKITNDLTSMITPDVTRFNKYINQKKNKGLLIELRISLEYVLKDTLCKLFGKKAKERFASAYTILCSKEDQSMNIF